MMQARNDIMRQLNDLALTYGKGLVSRQTGFLHLCHEKLEEEKDLSIPVVENLLYAYALFRSKTVEQVNEGKLLLEKLLGFQNRAIGTNDFGNFPVYLHEYPTCRDRFVAIHAAFILLALLKEFSSILSAAFIEILAQAAKQALQYAWNFYQEKLPPSTIALKLAAASIALEEIMGDSAFLQRGARALEQIFGADLNSDLLYCPANLGITLCAMALIEKKPSQECQRFLEFALHVWHPHLCCYIGPAYREWQAGLEPQMTLYDLFMSCYTAKLSSRMMKKTPAHLEAVLIPPAER